MNVKLIVYVYFRDWGIKLKLALTAIHSNNENIAVNNSKAQNELDEIMNSTE